jgi:hypothetical protein
MTTLSGSCESSEDPNNSNNTSNSTSSNDGQNEKKNLDDKLEFYSFDELCEGYMFGQRFEFEVFIDHILDLILQQANVNLVWTM